MSYKIEALFDTNGAQGLARCSVTMTALTNSGVSTFMSGVLSRVDPTNYGPFRPGASLQGACSAVFSDRTIPVPEDPNLPDSFGRRELIQRFNIRQADTITFTLTEPSPLTWNPPSQMDASHRYSASLKFDSWGGGRMLLNLKEEGYFLIGSTTISGESQTTFCFAFDEASGPPT